MSVGVESVSTHGGSLVKATIKQSQNFIDAARELGADGDPKAFDRALKKLAEAPPPDKGEDKKPKKDKPAK
jgi:hypothetical protein